MIDTTVDVHGISLPARTIIGYRSNGRPIYNIAGGAIDFTETDTDADAEDPLADRDSDDDDDDDDDAEEEYTPPTKEEWQKILDAKKKADSESAQRKRLLRDNGINPKTGEPLRASAPKLSTASDVDTDTNPTSDKRTVDSSEDAKALEKRLQREMERNLLDQEKEVRGEERSRAKSLIGAIPEALNTEGWNGKALPRILKLMDLDALEVDEDGVDGLEDQVKELKNDFPEFFKRTRMKDAANKVPNKETIGGGQKKTSSARTDGTWAENIARALHGGEG